MDSGRRKKVRLILCNAPLPNRAPTPFETVRWPRRRTCARNQVGYGTGGRGWRRLRRRSLRPRRLGLGLLGWRLPRRRLDNVGLLLWLALRRRHGRGL